MRAITGAANGARALVKGHYRLIDQPAESAVTRREHSRSPSRAHAGPDAGEVTTRCCASRTVPALNFTRRSQTQGLGAIGSNQTGAVARGLDLHTTLAVNRRRAVGAGRCCGPRSSCARAPESRGERQAEAARGAEVVPLESKGCATARHINRCGMGEHPGGVHAWTARPTSLDLFIERRAHAPQVELLVRERKVDRVLGRGEDCRRAHGRRAVCSTRCATGRPACAAKVPRGSAADRAG